MLAHNENHYLVSLLHELFAKNEQKAQLKFLFKEAIMREMIAKKISLLLKYCFCGCHLHQTSSSS